jgi:uroporphyrinogen-III synthase
LTKRVFITKPENEITALRATLALSDFTLSGHSFLTFQTTDDEPKNEIDIIFFGSTRSIIFLKAKVDLSKAKAIACIGRKTAMILRQMGFPPHFIGTESGNPSHVAKEFKTWCKGRSVLFPISNRSLKSISRVFPKEQIEEVTIYETHVTGKKINLNEVYVFTSPSNVEGFLLDNKLENHAILIAWGNSTKEALESRSIDVNFCLSKSTQEELAKLLASL